MKMLIGYVQPDSGSILFKGRSILDDRPPLQRKLGYLPENLPVYPELSVASYLDYPAELTGLSGNAKRQAIRWVLQATDLWNRLLPEAASGEAATEDRDDPVDVPVLEPTVKESTGTESDSSVQ